MNPPNPNNLLAEVIDRDAPHERIVAVLADALGADTVCRDGTRQPDHRIRLDAAKTLLFYRIGTPIQRTEITHIAETNDETSTEELLRRSPAIRDKFRKLLAKVDTINV